MYSSNILHVLNVEKYYCFYIHSKLYESFCGSLGYPNCSSLRSMFMVRKPGVLREGLNCFVTSAIQCGQKSLQNYFLFSKGMANFLQKYMLRMKQYKIICL